MRKTLIVIVGVFVAASLCHAGQPVIPLGPEDDAFVSAEAPDETHDWVDLWVVASPQYKSYLKFSLEGIELPVINSALMKLYCNQVFPPGYPAAVKVYATATDWQEETLIYFEQPEVISETLDTTTGYAGEWFVLNLSPYVKEQYRKGVRVFSFCVEYLMEQNSIFNSKEAGFNTPVLEISQTPVH